MASHHSFNPEKRVQLILIYAVKCTFFMQFFWTSNFKDSPFLCQLRQEKVIYLKRKPYYPLFERSFETGQIFVMKGSRRILVKLVLFQTRSTKTCLGLFMAKICPVSKLLSNNGYQGFLLRYITLSYLNWHRNGEPSNSKKRKKCLKKVHFTT